MKYILAVSGGVDSVVMLDMATKQTSDQLIVAHFDHGIRADSDGDARFVAGLAKRYELPFEEERRELGINASEDTARQARYAFLRRLAKKYQARIVTAHHQDDIIETIAINLARGTGWRGLAPVNDPTIDRPLKQYTKADLYQYALSHRLEWVEDETNATEKYLRNRIRRRLGKLDPDIRARLMTLYEQQCERASLIDEESGNLISTSRYFLTMIDDNVAVELLRAWLEQQSVSLTRPQRARLLHAVKSANPGELIEPGSGLRILFNRRDFIVKHPL